MVPGLCPPAAPEPTVNGWVTVMVVWGAASVVSFLWLARMARRDTLNYRVSSALGLLQDDCACGDQRPRREAWVHDTGVCYPAREWIGA